jgi:hypothetical protein
MTTLDQRVFGFLTAVSSMSSHSPDGGMAFFFKELDRHLDLQESFAKAYFELDPPIENIPTLALANVDEVPGVYNKFFTGATDRHSKILSDNFIEILNEAYSPFDLYWSFEKFDYGEWLDLVMETRESRYYLSLGWSFD